MLKHLLSRSVMIVDRGTSKGGLTNILNFNVGPGVDLALPPVFFQRCTSHNCPEHLMLNLHLHHIPAPSKSPPLSCL